MTYRGDECQVQVGPRKTMRGVTGQFQILSVHWVKTWDIEDNEEDYYYGRWFFFFLFPVTRKLRYQAFRLELSVDRHSFSFALYIPFLIDFRVDLDTHYDPHPY